MGKLALASSRKFNYLCWALHWSSAAYLTYELTSPTTPRIPVDRLSLNGEFAPVLVEAMSVPIYSLLVSFMTFTGAVHLLYALKFDAGLSFKYRFVEYAVSAPIMVCIIALLLGIREVYSLTMLAALTSITMAYGVLQEYVGEEWKFLFPFFLVPSAALVVFACVFLATVGKQPDRMMMYYTRVLVTNNNVTQGGPSPMEWTVVLEELFEVNPLVIGVVALVTIVFFRAWNLYSRKFSVGIGEVTLLGSLLTFTVVMLTGLREAYFVTMAVLTFPTAVTLFYIDKQIRDGDNSVWVVSPHVMGFVPYAATWGVILGYYGVSVAKNEGKPPWFVNVIVIVEFFMFSSFALVQYWYLVLPQRNSGSSGQYRTLDKVNVRDMDGAYNVLSIVSKLFLCWLLVGGIASQEQ